MFVPFVQLFRCDSTTKILTSLAEGHSLDRDDVLRCPVRRACAEFMDRLPPLLGPCLSGRRTQLTCHGGSARYDVQKARMAPQ
jgi:hypothetical protein